MLGNNSNNNGNIDSQIRQLKQLYDDINAAINKLATSNNSNISAEITALNTELKAVENQFRNISNIDLNKLKSDLMNIQQEVTNLKSSNFTDITQNFNDLQQVITSMANNIKNLKDSLNVLNTVPNNDMFSNMLSEINNIKSAWDNVINNWGSITIASPFNQINEEDIKNKYKSIADDIKSIFNDANLISFSNVDTSGLEQKVMDAIHNAISSSSNLVNNISNNSNGLNTNSTSGINTDDVRQFNELLKNTTSLFETTINSQNTNIPNTLNLDEYAKKALVGLVDFNTHIKNTNNQITQGMPTENPIIRETIIHELPIRETVVQGPPTREMNIQQPNIRNTTVDSYVPTNGQIMDQTIGRNDYIGINYDRYLQSNKANHSYANNIDSTLNASQNMEDRINEIVFRRGAGISYGKSEDKLINKFDLHGIDNTNAQLQHQIANHSKMYNVNDGADSQLKRMIRDYNEAANNGVATPSDKKHLEDRMTDAAQSILGVAGKDSELADFFKVIKDPEQFKKLPDALKRVYKDMRSEISGTADSITQMIKLIENMGLEIDKDIIEKLKKSKSELTSTDESISNTMSGNSDNSGSLIGNILGAAKGVWGGFGTAMGAIGLGNLVPTSLGSLARMTIGGAATEYRRWGAMDMSGAAAAMNQGYGAQNPGIMNNILASNQNIGLDWYRATHGMVDFNEYANNANTLLTGVQGHYGQGADKLSGVSDMYNLSRTTFDIGKVFGVSSPQMADITKSFYKELGQGAKETSDQLLKLAETAQAANIPVGEYLKTIASLSVKFKGMGVDVSLASIGMNNMINGYGMTETEAENFIGGASNMVSHMSSSTGETAYFGNLAGISSNPWTNMRSVRDRWSLKNGKVSVNNNATTDAFKMIDQELALYSKIGGANKDLQWNTVYDRMKTLGMQDDQSASIATNLYMKGDMKNLETFFDKQLAGTDSKQQSVKIDGQADLERRIETTADKMDSLTQAENSLRLMQATMGQELKGMFDLIGGSLQDNILNLNDTMATLVKSMQSNKMVQGVENLLEQLVKHPGWALLGLIAGKIVGNAAKSFIASSIVGGGAGAAALNGGKVVSKGAINALKRAAGSIDKEALGSAFKTVGNGILNGTEKVLSNPITKVAAPLAIAGGIIWSNSDKYAIGDDSMSGHFNRDLKKYYEHKKNGTLTAKDKKAYKDAMDFGKKAFGTSSSSYLPSDAINYKDNQYNLTFGKKDRLYRDEDGHITGTFDNKGNFVPFKVNNKKSLTKDNQLIRDIFASNIQKEVYDKKGNLDFSKLANYTSNHPNWHPEDVKNFKKELNKFKKTSSNSKSNGTGAMQDELIKINNAIVGAHGKNKNNTFYDSKLGKQMEAANNKLQNLAGSQTDSAKSITNDLDDQKAQYDNIARDKANQLTDVHTSLKSGTTNIATKQDKTNSILSKMSDTVAELKLKLANPTNSDLDANDYTRNASGNGVKLDPNATKAITWLSRKYESGGDAGAWSNTAGDAGGASYGMFQFDHGTGGDSGSLLDFIKSLGSVNKNWSKELLNAYSVDNNNATFSKNGAFTKIWKQLAYGKDSSKTFADAQNAYAMKVDYYPAVKSIQKATGADLNNRSTAVREMLFATTEALGIGGVTSAIRNTFKGQNINKLSDTQIVKEFYQHRRATVPQNYKDTAIQQAWYTRLDNEENDVLAMLKKYGTTKQKSSSTAAVSKLISHQTGSSNKKLAAAVTHSSSSATKTANKKLASAINNSKSTAANMVSKSTNYGTINNKTYTGTVNKKTYNGPVNNQAKSEGYVSGTDLTSSDFINMNSQEYGTKKYNAADFKASTTDPYSNVFMDISRSIMQKYGSPYSDAIKNPVINKLAHDSGTNSGEYKFSIISKTDGTVLADRMANTAAEALQKEANNVNAAKLNSRYTK